MSETTDDDKRAPGPGEVYCRDCGEVISAQAELCPECGVRQRDPPSSSLDSILEELTEGGNPFIAAVLSVVFPGLGQLYNRELEKGIAVMAASFLSLLSVLAGIGLVLYPAVWLYALYDAYVVADRQADGGADTTTDEDDTDVDTTSVVTTTDEDGTDDDTTDEKA